VLVEKVVPAPRPEPLQSADSEETGVSAATAWEKLAEDFAKESFIRFGWLREGVFERFEGGKLFVRFPLSAQESSESIWAEQGLKDLESKLTRELSQAVRLELEWDGTMEERAPEAEAEPPPVRDAQEAAAPTTPEPPADPMEEFKNDPLIKKALELFKSTLQTNPA
jgi:hypothetical protein